MNAEEAQRNHATVEDLRRYLAARKAELERNVAEAKQRARASEAALYEVEQILAHF